MKKQEPYMVASMSRETARPTPSSLAFERDKRRQNKERGHKVS